MRNSQLLRHIGICLLLVMAAHLTACSSTPPKLSYQVDPKNARIWPPAPETPRFRYVGTLYGEQNLIREEEGGGFTGFLRWLAGLDSPKLRRSLVLQRPNSGLVDSKDRILVTDISRHSIMVFDQQQAKIFEWDLAAPEVGFKTPIGVVEGDNQTYYVTDADLKLVVQLDAEGNPIHSFGGELLKRPTGIARDPVNKRLYVADTHGHDIKVFSDEGFLIDVIGSLGTEIGQFNGPTHIFYARGQLYVTDTFNTRVQMLSAKGEFRSKFGRRGLYVGDLVRPKGVTVDSDGNIYVIESFHDYLLVYNKSGQFLMPVGGTGTEVGQFYLPSGVWADKNDKIYVADMFNGRIVILQYLGGDKAPDVAVSN